MSPFPLQTSGHQPGKRTAVDGGLIFDFGEELVGSAAFTVHARIAHGFDVFYGENRIEAERTKDFTCGWYHLPRDSFRAEPGTRTFRTPGRRAFRYLTFRPATGGVLPEISDVEAECRHYPLPDRGTFRCSDPLLNQAWELSERTTRLCMQQYYEDGVKRDGLLWIGDYRVQFLCNTLLFGDTALARKSLRMIAQSTRPDGIVPACAVVGGAHQHDTHINYMPNVLGKHSLDTLVILNYVTDFINAVREYVDFSGDPELLHELWPVLEKQIHFIASLTCGRAVPPEFGMHLDSHKGTWQSRGVFAFQVLEALESAASLAGRMNASPLLDAIRGSQGLHRDWIRTHLHFPGQPLLRNDPGSDETGYHVHTHALLSGYMDRDAFLNARHMAAGRDGCFDPKIGMAQFWHLLALCRAGDMETALAFVRRVSKYLIQHDATSCWEIIDPTHADKGGFTSDTVARSYCHGWSAAPAYLFPRFILGVEPLAPDMRSIRVRPLPGDLEWAEGSVPTPHGTINIRWEQTGASPHVVSELPKEITHHA